MNIHITVKRGIVTIALLEGLSACGSFGGAKSDLKPVSESSTKDLPNLACAVSYKPHDRLVDLVFEGGGAKGTVFVGALQALEAHNFKGRRFVGTSAGAITATFLAAGATADDLKQMVIEKTASDVRVFSTFMDIPSQDAFDNEDIKNSETSRLINDILKELRIDQLPGIDTLSDHATTKAIKHVLMKNENFRLAFSFVERGGAYEGQKFVTWLTEKLDSKCSGLGSATLAEFNRLTGRELIMVASDTYKGEMLILNSRSAPDLPVVWAVRMSMSIPFLWQEVSWRDNWGKYNGRSMKGHTVVDGGLLSNFPISLLTNRDPMTEKVPVIGFLIDETLPVSGQEPKAGSKQSLVSRFGQLKPLRRINRLVDTATDAHDKADIAQHETEVCRLPALGYETTDFDMSCKRVDALISAGRAKTETFLAARFKTNEAALDVEISTSTEPSTGKRPERPLLQADNCR